MIGTEIFIMIMLYVKCMYSIVNAQQSMREMFVKSKRISRLIRILIKMLLRMFIRVLIRI
jgi:hypothetical protein